MGTDLVRAQLLLLPGLIEYLVAGGVICFGALVFTFAAARLPLREGGAALPPGAGS